VADLIRLETVNESLKRDLQNMTDSNNMLLDKINKLEKNGEREELLHNVTKCKNNMSNIRTENEKLRTELVKNRRKMESIQSTLNNLSNIQQTLDNQRKINKQLEDKVLDGENNKNKLSVRIIELKSEIKKLDTELKEKDQFCQQVKKEHSDIKMKCENYLQKQKLEKADLKQKQSLIKTQKEAIDILRISETNLGKEIEVFRDQNKKLSVDLKRSTDDHKTLKRWFLTEKNKTNRLENNLGLLKKENEKALENIQSLQKEFTNSIEDLDGERKNIKTLTESLLQKRNAFDLLKKEYDKIKQVGQCSIQRIGKYKRIRMMYPTFPTLVLIEHIDVHPNGYATIKFIYDNDVDTFTFKGNGGLQFIKNKSVKTAGKVVSDIKRKGVHSLLDFYPFSNKYKIECLEIVGVNTWMFKAPERVKYVELFHDSDWRGFMNITVKNIV
jgi:chromosome segregation ATPase